MILHITMQSMEVVLMRQHLQTLFIVIVSILGTLVYVEAKKKKNNSPWSNGFYW